MNNKGINFNQLVNNNGVNREPMFSDNSSGVFIDIGMTGVNDINKEDSANLNTINENSNTEIINIFDDVDVNNGAIFNDNTNINDNLEIKIDVVNEVTNASVKNKKIFVMLLTDRNFFLWLVILIFVFTSVTVGKAINLRSIVNDYEDFC